MSTANTPGNQEFVDDYKAIHGSEPSRFLAQEYAAVQVFAAALKNAPSTSADDIRNALANIKDLDTILGKFTFQANGQAVYDPIILVVNNGALEVLQ